MNNSTNYLFVQITALHRHELDPQFSAERFWADSPRYYLAEVESLATAERIIGILEGMSLALRGGLRFGAVARAACDDQQQAQVELDIEANLERPATGRIPPVVEQVAQDVARVCARLRLPAREGNHKPAAVVRAMASFEYACSEWPDLVPGPNDRVRYPRSLYDKLREHGCTAYGDAMLPAFDSWKRYLRQGHADPNEPKASSRIGRGHGPSIVSKSDI